MNLLTDVLTYIRRIIKTPSNAVMTDNLLIDYVNRFCTCDLPARLQLFELKTKFNMLTAPLMDQYNIPYYPEQTAPGGVTIAPYPMYQMLMDPVCVDGVLTPFFTDRNSFVKVYPNFFFNEENDTVGDGGSTYSFSTVNNPIERAHIDVIGVNAYEQNEECMPYASLDSGVYISAQDDNDNVITLQDVGPNYPPALATGNANIGNLMLQSVLQNTSATLASLTTAGTVNYSTGAISIDFSPTTIPSGNTIQVKYVSFSSGVPRIVCFYNNVIKVRPIPDDVYLLEFDAYLTPAAFLNSASALPFGYMAEYIARGAARKILSDTGDIEQFGFYEQLFKEQEMLVVRRTDRQRSISRTSTIFSDLTTQNGYSTQTGQGT